MEVLRPTLNLVRDQVSSRDNVASGHGDGQGVMSQGFSKYLRSLRHDLPLKPEGTQAPTHMAVFFAALAAEKLGDEVSRPYYPYTYISNRAGYISWTELRLPATTTAKPAKRKSWP